jgi:hypothetical protein
MLESMWFLWCDSFMFTFVLFRLIKLNFLLMTNFVNLNMLGFMFDGHHPFLYLLCMHV